MSLAIFDIYEARWLYESQEAFAQWAIRECFKDHHIGAIVESNFVMMLGQNFTRRIISQVRRAEHGGMLIIIRAEDVTKIVDPMGSIRPKYWIKETRASQRSRELLYAVIRTLSQLGAEHGLKTVGWKDYQELEDEAGTRHRAAYRLSCQHPECMNIVVSQDGAVRYVGNLIGKVTYWELGPFKR